MDRPAEALLRRSSQHFSSPGGGSLRRCIWFGPDTGTANPTCCGAGVRAPGGRTRSRSAGPGAWMPDAAADSQGNLYVAWDSYRAGNYDIFLRRVGRDGALGPLEQVTKSPRFQAHASVAVDRKDRVVGGLGRIRFELGQGLVARRLSGVRPCCIPIAACGSPCSTAESGSSPRPT